MIIPYNINNFRHFRYTVTEPYQDLINYERGRDEQASLMPSNQRQSIFTLS